MNRLATRFEECRARGRAALIPFITAGDPTPDATVPILHALVAAGADVLEIGVPFTDPMADGPTIQAACERALEHGTRLVDVLAMVAEFRKTDADTPVVLMGYLNPIESLGVQRFADAGAQAGVDGVLAVDMIPEEAEEFTPVLRAAGLESIYLVAPTTRETRLRHICAHAGGFLYYVSLKGVTGAATLEVSSLGARVAQLRQYTDLPIAIGFGVRTPETAAAVSCVADAVVVGSALVSKIADNAGHRETMLQEVAATLGNMRQAMDDASEERKARQSA